jgi:hypothetical protein
MTDKETNPNAVWAHYIEMDWSVQASCVADNGLVCGQVRCREIRLVAHDAIAPALKAAYYQAKLPPQPPQEHR